MNYFNSWWLQKIFVSSKNSRFQISQVIASRASYVGQRGGSGDSEHHSRLSCVYMAPAGIPVPGKQLEVEREPGNLDDPLFTRPWLRGTELVHQIAERKMPTA